MPCFYNEPITLAYDVYLNKAQYKVYGKYDNISPWSVQRLGQMCPKYWKLKKDISSIWSGSGGGS